jgi:hypothetical protein
MARKTTATTRRTSPAPKPKRRTRRESNNGAADAPPVRVRMYRVGLGDCFLLSFGRPPQQRHMLIDCGTLGKRTTKLEMKQILAHIKKETGGKLEVLVATHAHKDHVSGFQAALKIGLQPRQVWMPWTEDPADALARKLGNQAEELRLALVRAYNRAGVSAGLRDNLLGISDFEDCELSDDGVLAMGKTISQTLDVLRGLKQARVRYHSPGDAPIEVPGIEGFRFYVLGPPRDPERLSSMGEHGSGELYGLVRALGVLPGADPAAGTGVGDDLSPFDARFCYPIDHVGRFFPEYGTLEDRYRRIDGDWTEAAIQLADTLDRFRNNTSLVLAIERIADGRVLLFPADAQEGNMLSWHDPEIRWRVNGHNGRDRKVDATDLLKRTVFYKVGHHCSHNATAKGKGLEIMRQNRELTAFIPVDRALASDKSPKGSWKMPAAKLFRELLEACNGRVYRADVGWAGNFENSASPENEQPLRSLATPQDWKRWKSAAEATAPVEVLDEAIEYTLE